MKTGRLILHYPSDVVNEPILYHLVKDFDLVPNIIKASVNPDQEGFIALELQGEEAGYDAALDYLRSRRIAISPFSEGVLWDAARCTHCGACTGVCKTGALTLNRPEMTVLFQSEKCVACTMCITACPVGAVRLDF